MAKGRYDSPPSYCVESLLLDAIDWSSNLKISHSVRLSSTHRAQLHRSRIITYLLSSLSVVVNFPISIPCHYLLSFSCFLLYIYTLLLLNAKMQDQIINRHWTRKSKEPRFLSQKKDSSAMTRVYQTPSDCNTAPTLLPAAVLDCKLGVLVLEPALEPESEAVAGPESPLIM